MGRPIRPTPLIISGPSGSGKGTIITELKKIYGRRILFSVSHTTRQPRPGEVHGVHYNFVSKPEFEDLIQRNQLIEYTTYNQCYYGTTIGEMQRLLSIPDAIPIIEIETQGVKQVAQRTDISPLYIQILPPKVETLKTRLLGRGTNAEDDVKSRLARAAVELEEMKSLPCDLVIYNDVLENAVQSVTQFVDLHMPLE